ncbi:hypothetical protein PMAYCL1PPCAC_16252, partial [Pristionchus mayeri]
TFSSGLAASSAVLSLLEAGDHIICAEDIYGGALQLIRKISVAHHAVEAAFVDLTISGELEKAFKQNTKMIWFESPSNPLLKVVDIQKVVATVRKANPDIIIVVDNIFMTPYFQRPLSLGVDIVVHSLTKYINGHSDVLMGCAMTDREDAKEHLFFQ